MPSAVSSRNAAGATLGWIIADARGPRRRHRPQRATGGRRPGRGPVARFPGFAAHVACGRAAPGGSGLPRGGDRPARLRQFACPGWTGGLRHRPTGGRRHRRARHARPAGAGARDGSRLGRGGHVVPRDDAAAARALRGRDLGRSPAGVRTGRPRAEAQGTLHAGLAGAGARRAAADGQRLGADAPLAARPSRRRRLPARSRAARAADGRAQLVSRQPGPGTLAPVAGLPGADARHLEQRGPLPRRGPDGRLRTAHGGAVALRAHRGCRALAAARAAGARCAAGAGMVQPE